MYYNLNLNCSCFGHICFSRCKWYIFMIYFSVILSVDCVISLLLPLKRMTVCTRKRALLLSLLTLIAVVLIYLPTTIVGMVSLKKSGKPLSFSPPITNKVLPCVFYKLLDSSFVGSNQTHLISRDAKRSGI